MGLVNVRVRVRVRVRARVEARLGLIIYRGERVARRICERFLSEFEVVLHVVDELAGHRGHIEDTAESRDGLVDGLRGSRLPQLRVLA